MWAIFVKIIVLHALKSCQKGNKLPNLVTLSDVHVKTYFWFLKTRSF